MVFDRIEEQERYYGLHPMMEEAFAFLAESDTLNPGRYELSGGMYAMVSEGDTRQTRDVQLEAHKKYIDLQYCFAGGERMAWAHVQELEPVSEYDPEKDIYFLTGPCTTVSVKPGNFSILFPSDGTRPAATTNLKSITRRSSSRFRSRKNKRDVLMLSRKLQFTAVLSRVVAFQVLPSEAAI